MEIHVKNSSISISFLLWSLQSRLLHYIRVRISFLSLTRRSLQKWIFNAPHNEMRLKQNCFETVSKQFWKSFCFSFVSASFRYAGSSTTARSASKNRELLASGDGRKFKVLYRYARISSLPSSPLLPYECLYPGASSAFGERRGDENHSSFDTKSTSTSTHYWELHYFVYVKTV